MKKHHISFTKIGQFRETIRSIEHSARFQGYDDNKEPIFDNSIRLPIVNFIGRIKTHGTNSSVVMNSEKEFWVQSRKNIITLQSDNAGFAFFAEGRRAIFEEMLGELLDSVGTNKTVAIFGEFIGSGIQNGVAVSKLSKRMIIFAVKVFDEINNESIYLGDEKWAHLKCPDKDIYNIQDFESFALDIDFENPKLVQNRLIEITEYVEKECPIGRAFGISGVGEGVVWTGWYKDNYFRFKVKGEKHSVSKVKTLANVDIEKLKSIEDFAEYAVTENRLKQGVEQLFGAELKDCGIHRTGDFINWVMGDILTEEIDTLIENGLEAKDVGKNVRAKAALWFKDFLKS